MDKSLKIIDSYRLKKNGVWEENTTPQKGDTPWYPFLGYQEMLPGEKLQLFFPTKGKTFAHWYAPGNPATAL